jgi:hypothetical protein
MVLRHNQIFQRRHLGKQPDVLKSPRHTGALGNAEAFHLLKQEGSVWMIQRQTTNRRLIKSREAIENGGFARAVRADNRGDFTSSRFKG